jgi:hypothetical protein
MKERSWWKKSTQMKPFQPRGSHFETFAQRFLRSNTEQQRRNDRKCETSIGTIAQFRVGA